MAKVDFALKTGISQGDTAHTNCVLREPCAGDVIAANEESEKVVMVPVALDETGQPITEPQLVISPSLVSVHLLRRQIDSIGEIKGPIEIEIFNKLTSEDLLEIQSQAAKLEQAANKASRTVTQSGRPDSAGKQSD